MKAVLIHDGYFPTGSAFASRLFHLAKLFTVCGIDVHVIAAYSTVDHIVENNVYQFDDFTYQITDVKNRGSIDSFVGPRNFLKSVTEYLCAEDVDVVLTSRGLTYYKKLIKVCNKRNIKCYVEMCEWLDLASFKFGKIDPRYIKLNMLLHRGVKKFDGVIAISRLLEKHFKMLGLKTIRIPTIIDVEKQDFVPETGNKKTVIVFTGNLGGHKELMAPMINTLLKNQKLRENIDFHIYGPSVDQVKENVGKTARFSELKNVSIHGYVSHDEVLEAIKNADFQYFMRPNRRSSNAGFPTKLGESMSLGTPCITNNTGDISVYIRNEENGYIVDDNIAESLEKVLMEIVSQTKQQRRMMRENARKTAEKSFDLKQYQDILRDFLKA